MKTYEEARNLASVLVNIGNQFGKETIGFITDMNQPLGVAIGNWVEVVESVECLRGVRGIDDSSSDLMEVTHVLTGAMLMLGKKASNLEEGVQRSRKAITDGSAYKKFLELVEAQGGKVEAIENLEQYPLSRHSIEIKSDQSGFVGAIDPLEVGLTALALGAGRSRVDEPIDHKAGIILKKKIGDAVEPGETLALFLTDREEAIPSTRARLAKAFQISPQKPRKNSLILAQVTASGVELL
jgi:pyrimidine-nucleoside phosphorylase